MQYRRAVDADFTEILALQQQNLRSSLLPHERGQGFLSRAYTLPELQEMNASVGVIVATDQGQVCGYFCAATPAWYARFPFPAALITETKHIEYQGKKLCDYEFCIVNPMCIAKNYRATFVFLGLCQAMINLITPRYELALSFVAVENTHGLKSHTRMMQAVKKFEVGAAQFWMLLRDLRS